MELFIYLLKATGCTAAFYVVYYLLFRKLTFFSFNRWYLLSALVISLGIPAIHIGVQTLIPAPDVKPIIINTATQTIEDVAGPIVTEQTARPINWLLIGTCAYWLIAGLLLLKLLITLAGIIRKAINHGDKQNGFRVINQRSANNSSFFNYIFINDTGLDATEKEQVIAHEIIHAQKLHSADILFTEILKAVLWFNPFIYLFSKALCQSHEFEVDHCLSNRYNSKTYAGLLLKLSSAGAAGLVNQFSAYGLKSRINMLFGTRSLTAKKFTYLLALPVTMALVYFLSVQKVYAYNVNPNDNFVIILDAGHGGTNFGGHAPNGLNEKDINLQLVQQIKAVADERGIKTVLTRTDDRDVTFANRLIPKGDIFVSVHVNSVPDKTSANASGINVITSDKNKAYPQSQQLAKAFAKEFGQLKGLNTVDLVAGTPGIYILRENKLPAVILEMGYLTNKTDLKFLLDKQYQHDMAERFVDAVMAYKNTSIPVIDTVKKTGSITQPKIQINKMVVVDNYSRHADTAIKVKIQPYRADTAKKGHLTYLGIGYSDNDIKDINAYNEFKKARFMASDSTIMDNKSKTVYLYNGEITSGNYNIKAKFIKFRLKDSLISANGGVYLNVKDVRKPNGVNFYVDSLTLDLRNHPKRPSVRRN